MKLLLQALLAGCLLLAVGWAWAAQPSGAEDTRKAVVQGNNEFAFDLFAQLRGQGGNLFFSPNSLSTALAMTYTGARGQTADQMARTLHFTLDRQQVPAAFAGLVKELNGDGQKRGYQLSVADALWGQQGYPFLPEFLKVSRQSFGAGLHEVDFATSPEAARQTINAWVEKETRDKIKDLLPEGVLTTDTRLVLTNAIYFKGNWIHQFSKNRTREEPFSTSEGQKVQVPMMHQKDSFKYLDSENLQALEMPYEGKDLSMVVFLPRKADGLNDLEKALTAAQVTQWLSQMHPREVEVTFPKFQMTAQFGLADVLSRLGMPSAFQRGSADFSGMDGRKDLFLGAVLHKAFVDVNEEGTEAAAATGVVVGVMAARVNPVFRADHPFVFLIRENHTGSILFLGRVVNPKK